MRSFIANVNCLRQLLATKCKNWARRFNFDRLGFATSDDLQTPVTCIDVDVADLRQSL